MESEKICFPSDRISPVSPEQSITEIQKGAIKSNSDISLSQAESHQLSIGQSLLSEFKQMKLEKEAQKNWDLFYKRNTTHFFKDRHWTTREFEELKACREFESQRLVLLEAGCGVGNCIFPLLEEDRNIFIYACDFSPRAVDFVKNKMWTKTWSRNGLAAALLFGVSLYVYFLHLLPYVDMCSSEGRLIENYTNAERKETPKKPLLLIWVPPLGVKFDFNDCQKYYEITGCDLTYNRSLYEQADTVLFFHKEINRVGHMPKGPRPPLQKWIWYHVESPTNTQRIEGTEDKFNLTLSYRRDADITARFDVVIKDEPGEDFVLPKKDKLVCWMVSNKYTKGTGIRMAYYNELIKHIEVHVFGAAFTGPLSPDRYFPTMESCKFYLAFENSIHKDYITEKVNGPLCSGTVPIVLGPPRDNYEEFMPSDSFIHINDFPDAKALAEHLLELDKNDEKYIEYFRWRQFYKALPHLLTMANEFTQPTCLACDYISQDNRYSAVHNLYDWYFV